MNIIDCFILLISPIGELFGSHLPTQESSGRKLPSLMGTDEVAVNKATERVERILKSYAVGTPLFP